MAEPSTLPIRRPFHGSCHCKAVRYIAYLTLPHTPASKPGAQFAYRCNCTICHKAGLFHMRLNNPSEDFILLSPIDPFGLGKEGADDGHDSGGNSGGGGTPLINYKCNSKVISYPFCGTCGVRCFGFQGQGEVRERDIETFENGIKRLEKVQAWSPKRGFNEAEAKVGEKGEDLSSYLSVNGQTIDAGQDGFDLREWRDKRWNLYYEYLEDTDELSFEGPFAGGAY